MSGAIRSYAVDAQNVVDVDTLLLYTKPSQKEIRYTKMKAFGHHFRIDDEAASQMQIYDISIASIFNVPTEDTRRHVRQLYRGGDRHHETKLWSCAQNGRLLRVDKEREKSQKSYLHQR